MKNNNKITTTRKFNTPFSSPIRKVRCVCCRSLVGVCSSRYLTLAWKLPTRISSSVMFSLAWFRINKCFIKIKYTHNNNSELSVERTTTARRRHFGFGWELLTLSQEALRVCDRDLSLWPARANARHDFACESVRYKCCFSFHPHRISSPFCYKIFGKLDTKRAFTLAFLGPRSSTNCCSSFSDADICKLALTRCGCCGWKFRQSRVEWKSETKLIWPKEKLKVLWSWKVKSSRKSCIRYRALGILVPPNQSLRRHCRAKAKTAKCRKATIRVQTSRDRLQRTPRHRLSSRHTRTSRWVIISIASR